MPDQLEAVAEATNRSSCAQTTESRRMRWFELCLLLVIAFGTFEYSSIQVLTGTRSISGFIEGSRWVMALFQEITSLLLLAYILRRRGLRLTDLGLRWSFRDLFKGVGLFVGSYASYIVGYLFVRAVHRTIFGATQTGGNSGAVWGHMGVFAIPFVLVNPLFEELIVRAYLMTEIRELTGSATLAVVLSVAVQASYHLYYGWQGVLMVTFPFLVFALYYAKSRNATPVVLAHGITDAISLLRSF